MAGAVRREPADGDAHYVLAMSLLQTGASLEAVRERELAERLRRATSTRRRKRLGGSSPARAERLKDYLAPGSARRFDDCHTGQRQAELAAIT
jgi:hypothetical protein